MPALCRQCCTPVEDHVASMRCPSCGSPRIIAHDELDSLAIGHIDADAFYL